MKALVLSLALSAAYVLSLCGIFGLRAQRIEVQIASKSFEPAPKEVHMSLHPKHFETAGEAAAAGEELSQQERKAQQGEVAQKSKTLPLQYQSDLVTYRGSQLAHLFINSESDSPLNLEVYDMSGKRVYHQHSTLEQGMNRYEFNLKYVQDGIYYVVARSAERQAVQKVLKQTFIMS